MAQSRKNVKTSVSCTYQGVVFTELKQEHPESANSAKAVALSPCSEWPYIVINKVKERIVLSEIHLRTTGRHLSMGSHSVICHPTDRAGLYSIYRPREDERLSWPTWLVTYRDRLPARPQTVTHPGTNRVWRSATTLIEANVLPLSQTANQK